MLRCERGEEEPKDTMKIPQLRKLFDWYVYLHGMEHQKLNPKCQVICARFPAGGLVAHSVGAGKTIIAIALLAEMQKQEHRVDPNLVLAPVHIVVQWKKEINRFSPQLKVYLIDEKSGRAVDRKKWSKSDVVVCSYDRFIDLKLHKCDFHRIIFDEPQDVATAPFASLLILLRANYRWALTATPEPIPFVLKLVWGEEIEAPYDLVLKSKFIRYRAKRNPPGECLPVPPLRVHMIPVSLRWQEMSVAHIEALKFNLQAAIRLASFRDFDSIESVTTSSKPALSLNAWVKSTRDDISAKISHFTYIVQAVQLKLERQIKERGESRLTDVLFKDNGKDDNNVLEEQKSAMKEEDEGDIIDDSHQMFDEEDGLNPEDVREFHEASAKLKEQKRYLTFLNAIVEMLSDPSAECPICYNLLSENDITVLKCLHPLCTPCVSILFKNTNSAACPLCRQPCNRQLLCTFKPEKPQLEDKEDTVGQNNFSSKIDALVIKVIEVLTKNPEDKILIFAQWDKLIEQIHFALLSAKIKNEPLSRQLSDRASQLESFKTNSSLRVLLLSYEHHASGINLDAANHVFIVHPYCPKYAQGVSVIPLESAQAYERQAVGRVHRYPQTKDVHVYRFYARGTVEEDLYQHWGWI
eukprot:TRINITY_DN9896_c0_g1_i1.p1 TRINITY_DN9896_c0_g1~~TRINITY_DN9896_c0_g1_i1.p1  ORF type:complete len:637 (+),score=134.37 TRINITY_DN9896_c0_g1_i1:119-2029(+)